MFQKLGLDPGCSKGRNNTASGDIHMGYSTPRKVLTGFFQQSGFMGKQSLPAVTLSWHAEVTELVGMSGCPQGLHFHFA